MATVQERHNRETGSLVTVERVSAGSDQRPFYTCTCEHDHGARHCDTLAEARFMAARPSQWCADCEAEVRHAVEMALWNEFDLTPDDPSGRMFGGRPLGDLNLWDLERSLRAARARRERDRVAA
jgi:hypothetical protein